MTFDIEIEGEMHTVHVESVGAADAAGGRFRVRIGDGDELVVESRRTDLGLSMLFEEAGRTTDAAVADCGGGTYLVQLPRVSMTATVDGRRFRRARADAGAATGEQRIIAPMPGRIVRVLVQPGEEVAARQGLVVVEAMKMENELIALRAGRVREVTIAEGASVEAGRLLVVVE